MVCNKDPTTKEICFIASGILLMVVKLRIKVMNVGMAKVHCTGHQQRIKI